MLAEALYRQERDEEAETLAGEAREIAAPDDVYSQFLWRAVQAKLLARRGAFDEAETLAAEAVRLTSETDNVDDHGVALMDLAEVRRFAGRADGARTALERAALSFDAKGNVVSAERARRLIAQTAAAT
jgi:tetratricopeptide (TPR) repeat protein